MRTAIAIAAIHNRRSRCALWCTPYENSKYSAHGEAIKYRLYGFPLTGPEKRRKKAIRTENCKSCASIFPFRFFLSIAGKEPAPAKAGDNRRGRHFFGYFLLAKQKKVTRRQAKLAAQATMVGINL